MLANRSLTEEVTIATMRMRVFYLFNSIVGAHQYYVLAVKK